jgi:glycosyltransferase involved in cell wall biosynthesis
MSRPASGRTFQDAASEPAPPKASVLVCTRDRPSKARRAVASILANTYRDYELIVVDQSADDRTGMAMRNMQDSRLRYVATATIGLSRSRNLAIRASRASILVFTDDDCICESGWLAAILREYDDDPSLMGVFGRVVPYGRQRDNMFCPAVIESRDRIVVDRPVIPSLVLGGGNNMSFRRAVFAKVGLFVESLGAGTPLRAGEDTEFIYRALAHRMRFAYSPKPMVQHDNWMSGPDFAKLMQGSILGGAAAITKYALTANGPALGYLIRIGYRILRDRFGAGSAIQGTWCYVIGCLAGLRYVFVSPPRLSP